MSSALQRPHILIVSDDPDLSAFLGEGLIYAGFWTSVIASALQVLEVFRLRSFDAVVVDAALGGLGAPELLQRLRGHTGKNPGEMRTDVPVLVVAASAEEIPPAVAARADIAAILVAPLEIVDLASVLNHAIGAWRALHPDRPWADEAALQASDLPSSPLPN